MNTRQVLTREQEDLINGMADSLISTVNKQYSLDVIIGEIEDMLETARKFKKEDER